MPASAPSAPTTASVETPTATPLPPAATSANPTLTATRMPTQPIPTAMPTIVSPTATPPMPTATATQMPTQPIPTAMPTVLNPTVSPLPPTATSPIPTATQMPTEPILTATPTVLSPTATATSAATTQVAIGQASSYERGLIRQQMRDLLDELGGLGDVISAGDRVAIKVNLTGGTKVRPLPGIPAIESYVTHPEVVHALGELVRDAGARELFIVEAVYEWESYELWGYEEVAEALDATLIDLNDTRPYNDFASTPVGAGSFIYPEFTFNHILEDVDVFMSVAKMKNHWNAGVTHSVKNLIGLVPARFYRLGPKDNYRSAFHGQSNETKARLPRVIVDLNRARPIHFALIDGIKTTQGGGRALDQDHDRAGAWRAACRQGPGSHRCRRHGSNGIGPRRRLPHHAFHPLRQSPEPSP